MPPLARDPAVVVEDVRDGYVSVARAAQDYGVVIDTETNEVDVEATAARRNLLATGD